MFEVEVALKPPPLEVVAAPSASTVPTAQAALDPEVEPNYKFIEGVFTKPHLSKAVPWLSHYVSMTVPWLAQDLSIISINVVIY